MYSELYIITGKSYRDFITVNHEYFVITDSFPFPWGEPLHLNRLIETPVNADTFYGSFSVRINQRGLIIHILVVEIRSLT